MLKTLLAALLAFALLGIAAPAAAAPPECVQYAYVADYHWYYACADTQDASCKVYLKERHGMTESRDCLVPVPQATTGAPGPVCVPTSGGLDYPSWACVDAGNPKCAAYTVTTSDAGVQKRCFGVLA